MSAAVIQFKRTCLECGEPFETKARHGEFCSRACRNDHGNRRIQRGGELYDLFMSLRYDRDAAALVKAWKVMCRLAAHFREEDLRQRAGRKSWRPAREVIARRPWILADIIHNKTWRKVGR